MAKGRENFGSGWTAVMAMAGSAIGLGNIWRFPYMVGENGGAAFIIVYLLSSFLLSLPIFLSESIIGRNTHSNIFGSMDKLAPGTKWKWLGFLTVLSPLIIISYYSVVGGWSIGFLAKSLASGFGHEGSIFDDLISSTWIPLLFHTVFLGLCAIIVAAGIKSGIERFNKISLPMLFVLMLLIMTTSLCMPGASAGVSYMVKPDFSKLTPSIIASAMGQSFFSLSLGVGTILTFSSYIRNKDDLFISGVGTAFFDLIFALIAGFAIMPAVFSAGIEPGAGPGLIFETLPYIFAKMGVEAQILSRVVSILFFLTIVIAALTSAISMLEVGVAYLVEEKQLSRRKAVWSLFALTWTLGALCSLSFGPLSGFHICGETIFSFCDKLTSNFLMTFGSLLFVLFVGWKMKRADIRNEFTNNGSLKFNDRIFGAVYFFIRYLSPVVILIIFVTNLIA